MKKYSIPFILLFSLLLSACGALGVAATEEPTPTISAEDIRATADIMVYEMLTQTQAAMPPTNTPVPPTNTPLPLPTETPITEPTATSAIEGVASPTAVVIATQPSSDVSCADQPLGKWTGDSVSLAVTNNVKDTTANIFLCITTPYNELGYIGIPVVKSGSASVPLGCYYATAWVSGKKNFNASTYFCLKNTTNVQLVIDNNSLILKAGCAPNC